MNKLEMITTLKRTFRTLTNTHSHNFFSIYGTVKASIDTSSAFKYSS